MKKNFNLPMHHFRGIAILCIVFVHVWIPQNVSPSVANIWEATRITLFFASTTLFAFIGGYLAVVVENTKYTAATINGALLAYSANYLIKKFKNVYCPMIFVSLMFCCRYWFFGKGYLPYETPEGFWNWLRYISLGGVQPQFWYIPFTMIMFLITPYLQGLSKAHMGILGFCVFLIPFIVYRGDTNIQDVQNGFDNFLHLLGYHGPHFILGMTYARYESEINIFIYKHWKFLILIACIVSFGLFIAIRQQFPTWNTEIKFSLLHVQKLLFCLLFIFFLTFIKQKNYFLDLLARYSFCIFFLHGIVAWGYCFPLVRTIVSTCPVLNTDFSMICLQTMAVFLSLVICIFIGKVFKCVFGKYSRLLLGC